MFILLVPIGHDVEEHDVLLEDVQIRDVRCPRIARKSRWFLFNRSVLAAESRLVEFSSKILSPSSGPCIIRDTAAELAVRLGEGLKEMLGDKTFWKKLTRRPILGY